VSHLDWKRSRYHGRPYFLAYPDEYRGTEPGVIDAYYAYTDHLIGRLLKYADEETTVIIVSDHGFMFDESQHYGGPPGVIMASGNGIAPGSVQGASLYDVAPTVLHLLGLPLARDMRGRVVEEMFTPEMRKEPAAYIATYETGAAREGAKAAGEFPGSAEGFRKQMKGLGYLE